MKLQLVYSAKKTPNYVDVSRPWPTASGTSPTNSPSWPSDQEWPAALARLESLSPAHASVVHSLIRRLLAQLEAERGLDYPPPPPTTP